jgi:rod shape determining protein RodA
MFKNHDWFITILVFILISIGSVTIYSITYISDPGLISKQIYIILIGLIFYFGIYIIDYSWLKENKILTLIYLGLIGLLLFVRFFSEETAGTNRWISIGAFNLQPAEFAKIAAIVFTAHILGKKTEKNSSQIMKELRNQNIENNYKQSYLDIDYLKKILKSAVFIFPILGLVLIQPSLGNTIITFSIWLSLVLLFYTNQRFVAVSIVTFVISAFLMYFIWIKQLYILSLFIPVTILITNKLSKVSLVYVILFSLLGSILIPTVNYGWTSVLKDYQKQRVESFLNPESDPLGAGWQVRQSQIAIGSGRVFGRGFRQGTQASLGILPFAHTDFIFASFAEQFGFVGSIFLLLVLFALPVRIFLLANEISSKYDQIIMYGIGILLLLHIVINIGMNLGKLPVTGIPLPFISYGGSSLLSILIALGLIQNILKYNRDTTNFEKILPKTGYI